MSASSNTVLVERRGAIALVTLNRPERRNGVTLPMCEAFYATLKEIAESDARLFVLRGAGDDFCVGADVKGSGEGEHSQLREDEPAEFYHSATLIHTMPQVTLAAIDGGCAGAGMGWAMACDLRFATSRARFSTAFLNVGVSGDMGLAWSLHHLVGGGKARELMFLPERFGGEDALSLGLVNRLFAPDQLHSAVLGVADQLASRDALALRLMKANSLSAEQLPIGEYIDIESARHLETTNRPEWAKLMAEGYARRKGN